MAAIPHRAFVGAIRNRALVGAICHKASVPAIHHTACVGSRDHAATLELSFSRRRSDPALGDEAWHVIGNMA
jgi:hypothetical protein